MDIWIDSGPSVVVWIGVALRDSCVWILGHRNWTIKCGLVGRSVSLWGWVLRSPALKLHPVWHTVSAACWSRCRSHSSFSSTMSACVPPCFLPWWQRTKPLNCMPAPIKCFLLEEREKKKERLWMEAAGVGGSSQAVEGRRACWRDMGREG